MKKIPFSLVRQAHFEALCNELDKHRKQVEVATGFVKEIELGNLDVKFSGDDDVENGNTLATSLISLRNQMKKFSSEEKQRQWVTEGLAKFVEILRTKDEDLTKLADKIISNLVRYLDANQGALYILQEEKDDAWLEMIACYAYGRKKHNGHRISVGDGLTGQTVLEKSTQYLTQIPPDYIRITSGLGEALPRNLLIVPLKIEEKVFGVVEIASFKQIQKFEIEFVEKLGESIAATISSVKSNEQTRTLLRESEMQAEHLRSQEEEMRQNMEELSATQEEMHRILKEVQGQEKYMNDLINASKDSILTVDKELRVINCNKVFKQTYSAAGEEIGKGFDLTRLFATEEEKEKYRRLYRRVFAGEQFEVTESYDLHGVQAYYAITYSPIHNDKGEIIAAAVFVKDVTLVTKAKNEAQQQAEELKAQEEELRQNMEELEATQDEMQRILSEVQSKERYLNDLINSSKDSILTIDRDYRIINFNEALRQSYVQLGLLIEKGFDMKAIFSEEEWPKFKRHYDRAFGGENFEVAEHYRSHGFDAHFLIHYNPLRNDKGEIVAVSIFSKETTALIKAQQQIEQHLLEAKNTQRYYNDMIEGMSDCVLTIDKDFNIVVANSAFVKLFSGYGLKIARGESLLQMGRDKEEAFKQPYLRAFAGETVVDPDRHHFDRDFHVYYSPLRNSEGEIMGVCVVAHDITERVKLQQQTETLLEGEKSRAILLEKNRSALTALTKSKHIQDGNLREGLEAITKALVEQLGVSRAAIWKMEELTEGIVLEKMFQRSSLEFVDGGQLLKKDFPLYFNSVVSEEVIVADDVHSHASLVEFKKGYLDTYNIVSMLDAPFYLNGKVGGVICCENQHQQKSWTQEDIDFIKSVADIVSLAYKSSESKNLLNKALHQAEELQAQEEEMRQQLEELTATQDALNEKMNALEETSKNLEIRERVLEYTTILSESDVYGNITFVNDKLCSVSQYDRSELVGKPHNVLRHPDMPKELFRNMWQTIKKGEVFKGVVKNKAKDGSAYWVDATIVPIKDDSGKIYKYVGARYHIEDIELAEALYDIQVKRLNLPPLPVKSERRRSA